MEIKVGDFVETRQGNNALDKPIYVVVGIKDDRLVLRKVSGSLTDKTSILNSLDIFSYPRKKFRLVSVKIERV